MRREKLRGAEAVANKVAGMIFGDPAKALVMSYVRQLVADGHAEWDFARKRRNRGPLPHGRQFHFWRNDDHSHRVNGRGF